MGQREKLFTVERLELRHGGVSPRRKQRRCHWEFPQPVFQTVAVDCKDQLLAGATFMNFSGLQQYIQPGGILSENKKSGGLPDIRATMMRFPACL
mmetsp:Transcript_1298/g.3090  ORF Transcript_1298/g.3090 Transcript_1298/m.3090 type:complete len:95 (-) Transcript_1298:543-827(-)